MLYSKWTYNAPVLVDTLFIIIVGYIFCLDGPSQLFLLGEKWLPPPRQMPPPITTSYFENMQVVQRLLNKKLGVSETPWKLQKILWLWWKKSKYLQHCIRMIHLLKAIVYFLPIFHALVVPNKFHLILYWNKWLRFYLYLNCLSVRNYEMVRYDTDMMKIGHYVMLCL